MNIRLLKLTLNCRESVEEIDLSAHITFFHGQISAGKSSIVRLIDYCLGGDLERTPAITKELVSVTLYARIGEFEVLLDREARGSNQVQVTWRNRVEESARVLAPLQATADSSPIWGTDVYTLSDLIFHLIGLAPPRVRKSKKNENSDLVRLSIRDLMFYCYLEQDHIDSSFFSMEDSFRRLKSRDVMRFVVGYHTERLSELDRAIEAASEGRLSKLQAAAQLELSLAELGYGTVIEIQNETDRAREALAAAKKEEATIREGQVQDNHLVDELRGRLRRASEELGVEEAAIDDQQQHIQELVRLHAELLSSRFKLGRVETASIILDKAEFEHCPLCGVSIQAMAARPPEVCTLCGTPDGERKEALASRADALQKDLDSRIKDLADALARHRDLQKKQRDKVISLRREKVALDRQLTAESQAYDSNYLARARDVERRIATLEEQIKGFDRIRRLPEMAIALRREADALQLDLSAMKREMEEERGRLTQSAALVRQIEDRFLDALLAVGIPGVRDDDTIHLDMTTWIPRVVPFGDEALRWGFDNAGSGGKKTLFKVCYALALHVVAATNDLPLPRFLIIDTPMKNIGEEVNKDLFQAFYRYLYTMAAGPLKGTQMIIVDKEYNAPDDGIEVKDRYMTPEDPAHPPLISYYRGA